MMNLSLAELRNWNRPAGPPSPSPFPDPCPGLGVLGLLGWSMFAAALGCDSSAVWRRHLHRCPVCVGLTCCGTCGTIEMMGKTSSHVFLPRSCARCGAARLGQLSELVSSAGGRLLASKSECVLALGSSAAPAASPEDVRTNFWHRSSLPGHWVCCR